MRQADRKPEKRRESERQDRLQPLEQPKLEKLGELTRVVKQSGSITVSGGRA